jgi:hypothetical protein
MRSSIFTCIAREFATGHTRHGSVPKRETPKSPLPLLDRVFLRNCGRSMIVQIQSAGNYDATFIDSIWTGKQMLSPVVGCILWQGVDSSRRQAGTAAVAAWLRYLEYALFSEPKKLPHRNG